MIFEDFLKCQEDESVNHVTPNYLHRNRYIYESEITVPGIFCFNLPSQFKFQTPNSMKLCCVRASALTSLIKSAVDIFV